MELSQASLGQMPSMNMGGYIPAPAYRPSVARQALLAFLGGAAGQVGEKLASGVMTPDYSTQAAGDKTLQAQGMAPEARNAFQRMFAPMSQEQYLNARQLAQQGQYQQLMGGLEKQRVGIEQGGLDVSRARAETERTTAISEAAARAAEIEQRKRELAEKASEFFKQFTGIEMPRSQAEIDLAKAQTAGVTASAGMQNVTTRRMESNQDEAGQKDVRTLFPSIPEPIHQQVQQTLGTATQYFRSHPNASFGDYYKEYNAAAQQIAQKGLGQNAPVVPPPQGLFNEAAIESFMRGTNAGGVNFPPVL